MTESLKPACATLNGARYNPWKNRRLRGACPNFFTASPRKNAVFIRQGKWFSVAVPELAVSDESLLPHRAPIRIADPSTFDNNGQYDVTEGRQESELAERDEGP